MTNNEINVEEILRTNAETFCLRSGTHVKEKRNTQLICVHLNGLQNCAKAMIWFVQ